MGLRRGEVLALTWDVVDLRQGKVTVQASRRDIGGKVATGPTKNGKTRVVPIPREVVTALTALKKQQAEERLATGRRYNREGFVMVNEDGVPLRPERYSHLFARHCHDAGLPRIRLHSLRHTAASLMAAAGVPIIDAAALLGHDPLVYSQVYAHVYDDGVSRAADTLTQMYR